MIKAKIFLQTVFCEIIVNQIIVGDNGPLLMVLISKQTPFWMKVTFVETSMTRERPFYLVFLILS